MNNIVSSNTYSSFTHIVIIYIRISIRLVLVLVDRDISI